MSSKRLAGNPPKARPKAARDDAKLRLLTRRYVYRSLAVCVIPLLALLWLVFRNDLSISNNDRAGWVSGKLHLNPSGTTACLADRCGTLLLAPDFDVRSLDGKPVRGYFVSVPLDSRDDAHRLALVAVFANDAH